MTGEPRMSTHELLAEVDWLLGGGMNPVAVAKQLDRTINAIEKRARRNGRDDLAAVFSGAISREREWIRRAAA